MSFEQFFKVGDVGVVCFGFEFFYKVEEFFVDGVDYEFVGGFVVFFILEDYFDEVVLFFVGFYVGFCELVLVVGVCVYGVFFGWLVWGGSFLEYI